MENIKKITATFALVLMLTITSLSILTTVNAQPVVYKDTYMYLALRPNPVGLGQSVLVVWWTAEMPRPETTEEETAGRRGAWYNVKVTITKPDGSNQIMGPYDSDPVGGNWFEYVPDTIGTYSFQATFPGQWRNTSDSQIYYKDAESAKVELAVQQEPIAQYPDWPLPDSNTYWYRPIEAENREWYQFSGNWLMSSYDASGKAFNP